MPADHSRETLQGRPLTDLPREAHLSLGRTYSVVHDAFEQLLRPYGITPTQYDVLQILDEAAPEGLSRNEIRDRLVTRMPDVTRLLDRMEEAGLVTRLRSTEDRRMVATRLTGSGRKLFQAVKDLVAAEHRRRLAHLTKGQLRTLIELLRLVRQSHD
jgi:DNA-binding MarR family transcriptional regulator